MAYRVVRRPGEPGGRAVYTERYAYVEWGGEKAAQLYDHQNDPYEYVNLIDDPTHLLALAQMRRLLSGGWRSALPD